MHKSRLVYFICLLLAVSTLTAYWRALDAGFVSYDDDAYVTENRRVQAGPTAESIKWAFAASHASNWHPLTWISHMADVKLYGLNPLGHHLTNVILHIFSTILLFLLLARVTGSVWRSALVAGLFALHPLHVESVAWVAERKDVLSTLFWMLTMHAYVSWTKRPGAGRYALTLLLFALGLMAKPMLVTLPIVLLLLDYWPLGRFAAAGSVRKLIWEKIPFFALTAASCVVTYFAQQKGESVVSVDSASVGVRVANALVSYVGYLLKMFWPAKLAVIYPHLLKSIPSWQVIGSAVVLVSATVLVVRAARTRPYLAMGWLWYLITLLPVIGLVQVGMQSMADRYTYVPLIGIFIAGTWGAVGRVRRLGPALAVIILIACAFGTWHQTGHWKDSISLFRRAVDVTDRNLTAETNLGIALCDRGRYREAIAHQEAALRIKPGAKQYNNIGAALAGLGELDEAMAYYRKAIEVEPEYARPYYNLGCLLRDKHRYREAVEQFREALVRDPDHGDSHYRLADSLAKLGESEEAVDHYQAATRLDPRNYLAHSNLGVLLNTRGDFKEAAREFRITIRLNPKYARAHYNLGRALDSLDKTDEAIAQYREAIRLEPDLAEAHNDLAIDLYTVGRYDEAWKEVGLARKNGVEPHPEFIKALSEKRK